MSTPSTDTSPPALPEAAGPGEVAPPLRSGRYRLRAVLGEGGMAVVYRAWDSRLEVERAIKVLLPTMAARPRIRERFHAEARTMARLSHPHIVSVQDVDAEGDRVFIVMELLRGGTLWSWVEQHGAMPARMALDGMLPVLSALHAAHQRGVVHRDVKPQNVLLTADGVPKMTDFGIARIEDSDSRTRTAAVMGTWTYMPPEQRKSAKDTDPRADLYAAGATLWALLRGEDPPDLFASDMDPGLLAGLPAPLAEVVRKATRYRREDRYASAAELAAALEACRASLPELIPGAVVAGPAPILTSSPVSAISRSSFPPRTDPDPSGGTDPAATEAGHSIFDPGRTLPPEEASGQVPPARLPAAGPGEGPAPVAGTMVPSGTLADELELSEGPPEPRRSRLPLVLGGALALAAVVAVGLAVGSGMTAGEPVAATSQDAQPAGPGVPGPPVEGQGEPVEAPVSSAVAAEGGAAAAGEPASSQPARPTPPTEPVPAQERGSSEPEPAERTAEPEPEEQDAELEQEPATAAAPPPSEPQAGTAAEPDEAEPAASEPQAGTAAEPSEPQPAASEPAPAEAEPEPQPAPQPSGPPSRVTVSGDVYAVSIVNRATERSYRPGASVPPGEYDVYLRFPDEAQAHKVHSFRAAGGWAVNIRCVPRDKTCQ